MSMWKPMAEKVLWTFVQAAAVAFAAASSLDWSAGRAALAAGVAAVVTLGLSAVSAEAVREDLGFYRELGLRVVRSSVAAFLSFLLVDPGAVLTGKAWQGAVGAAAMAALVVVKGMAAQFVGDPDSPATLRSVPSGEA